MMELTEHGVAVLKAIKSQHVEAIAKVMLAPADTLEAVRDEQKETLGELMRIIRVVPLGMPRDG
jgi:hypothetical protein